MDVGQLILTASPFTRWRCSTCDYLAEEGTRREEGPSVHKCAHWQVVQSY